MYLLAQNGEDPVNYYKYIDVCFDVSLSLWTLEKK